MNEWVKIQVKFPRHCETCRKTVHKDTHAWWLKGKGLIHDECYNKEGGNSKQDATPKIPDTPFPDNPTEETTWEDYPEDYPEENDDSTENEGDMSNTDGKKKIIREKFRKSKHGKSPRKRKIAEDLLETKTVYKTKEETVLHKDVGKKWPMIYSTNTGKGYRTPKSQSEQDNDFLKEVDTVYNEINKYPEFVDLKSTSTSTKTPFPAKDKEEETPDPEPPKPKALPKPPDTKEWYLKEVRRLRSFCERSKIAGQYVDHISMRPITDGKKVLAMGIPPTALIHAMTMHWSPETKETAKVPEFDSSILRIKVEDNEHVLLPYVAKLAEARIPILIVGEKGIGKSYLANQLADKLGLKYGFMSLNGATTPSWFFGNWTAAPENPYKTRPFKEIYRDGGVFCFDEIDAGEPNMLLILNNLISNDILHCPMTGDAIPKHPDFIIVATANTFGLGANKEYRGRERLDDATLDRFRMGRVLFTLDEKLEEYLFTKE